MTDVKKVTKKTVFSETQYYTVERINSDTLVLKNEQGEGIEVSKDYAQDCLISADQFIKEGGRVEVVPTSSSWFGVTYKEDAPFVEKSLNDLIKAGEYPPKLWEK